MKTRCLKLLGFIIIIVFLITLFYYQEKNYKDDIGAYDIYTLVKIEKSMDHFVYLYNRKEIDNDVEETFIDEMQVLSEYLRRSPVLKFMSSDIYNLNDLISDGYSDKDIILISNLQKEIRRITLLLHDSEKENIGERTYNYFKKESNITKLKELLSQIE